MLPQVLIHPLSIAGWCGAITTALNLLPVGSLDGGRMVQVRGAAGAAAVGLVSACLCGPCELRGPPGRSAGARRPLRGAQLLHLSRPHCRAGAGLLALGLGHLAASPTAIPQRS
jgi:hypothetical protein